MRMANERDQEIVRAAVSDAAANILGFLPSLGTREAFAFGEGVALPTRLRFRDLPAAHLPRCEAISDASTDFGRKVGRDFIDLVINRWRGASLARRPRPADEEPEASPVQTQRIPLDPERYSILKKQVGAAD
jgi:DNA helicase HerA-like ATPase